MKNNFLFYLLPIFILTSCYSENQDQSLNTVSDAVTPYQNPLRPISGTLTLSFTETGEKVTLEVYSSWYSGIKKDQNILTISTISETHELFNPRNVDFTLSWTNSQILGNYSATAKFMFDVPQTGYISSCEDPNTAELPLITYEILPYPQELDRYTIRGDFIGHCSDLFGGSVGEVIGHFEISQMNKINCPNI